MLSKMPDTCARVTEIYEERVRQYGYSLEDLDRVDVTDLTQPFML